VCDVKGERVRVVELGLAAAAATAEKYGSSHDENEASGAIDVSTFAGRGEVCGVVCRPATFSGPEHVAVDVAGNVVVLESDGQIRIIDPTKNTIRTLDTQFNDLTNGLVPFLSYVEGICIDGAGNIHISQQSKGVHVITNTGLSAGYHAWTDALATMAWKPTVSCHHGVCSFEGRRSVVTVLLVALRADAQEHTCEPDLTPIPGLAPLPATAVAAATASTSLALSAPSPRVPSAVERSLYPFPFPFPALPPEIWFLILGSPRICELGGGANRYQRGNSEAGQFGATRLTSTAHG
jgi:hypothetical protein